MSQHSVVVVAPVRTAIGTFGGCLKEIPAPDLGAVVIKAAVARAGLAPEEIEFPFRKWTQFRNLEVVGHKLLVDPQRLRKEYRKNFENFCKELREQAGKAHVDYHMLRTDEPVERALGLYLTKRQSRK